jgi:hypothetical protein
MDSDMHPNDPLLHLPPVPPTRFFALLDSGLRGSSTLIALHAAAATGLIDQFLTPSTPEAAAVAILADIGVVRALCSALLAIGVLERENSEDGGYEEGRVAKRLIASPYAAVFLARSSPYFQGAYIEKIVQDIVRYSAQVPGIMRDGPVSLDTEAFFADHSLRSMGENALTGRLQRTVSTIASIPRFPLARRMIDLGGGHGLYAIALTRLHRSLEAVVMDLPGVIPLTQEFIARYKADRVQAVPGNFFTDDLGGPYDLVFSSSNPSGKKAIMVEKITAALSYGGSFVNLQSPGNFRKDPLLDLEGHLWTLCGARKEDTAYTRDQPFLTAEYREAMARHGLVIRQIKDIPDEYHAGRHVILVIAEKVG